MPDLTTEYFPVCEQTKERHEIKIKSSKGDKEYTVILDPTGNHTCTCPHFTYSTSFFYCKHIEAAFEQICTWRGFLDEPQQEEGVCPRCGGPTTYEGWAV